MKRPMKVALASPPVAQSLAHALELTDDLLAQAAAAGAVVACFPEAWIPGLRGQDFEPFPYQEAEETEVLQRVGALARKHAVATIMGMERITRAGRQIVATVFGRDGEVSGSQVKCQLDPTEEPYYIPGDHRELFEVDGLKFGIAICHEGWRYPETVRWAARRGAVVVFHPQLTGGHSGASRLTEWGASGNPYYEQAMRMRSIENTVYFASVNYAVPFAESATSIIDPTGVCVARLGYGETGVLIHEISGELATGLLARRLAPERLRGN